MVGWGRIIIQNVLIKRVNNDLVIKKCVKEKKNQSFLPPMYNIHLYTLISNTLFICDLAKSNNPSFDIATVPQPHALELNGSCPDALPQSAWP